jgi:hypothetical protein
VTDTVTGLVWQQTATPQTFAWTDAKCYCAGLSLGGITAGGWRLPTRIELLSLVDFTQWNPSINQTAFPNARADDFWTSSPVAGEALTAWGVGFYNGDSEWYIAGSSGGGAIRCVH